MKKFSSLYLTFSLFSFAACDPNTMSGAATEYDNSKSGLEGKSVQTAIDELDTKVDALTAEDVALNTKITDVETSAIANRAPVLYNANDEPIGKLISIDGEYLVRTDEGYLLGIENDTQTLDQMKDVFLFYTSSDCSGIPFLHSTKYVKNTVGRCWYQEALENCTVDEGATPAVRVVGSLYYVYYGACINSGDPAIGDTISSSIPTKIFTGTIPDLTGPYEIK